MGVLSPYGPELTSRDVRDGRPGPRKPKQTLLVLVVIASLAERLACAQSSSYVAQNGGPHVIFRHLDATARTTFRFRRASTKLLAIDC
jgi:hypothetical protein